MTETANSLRKHACKQFESAFNYDTDEVKAEYVKSAAELMAFAVEAAEQAGMVAEAEAWKRDVEIFKSYVEYLATAN